jgi:hypothetical protein
LLFSARDTNFWLNKKIVVLLNLADDSVYTKILGISHSKVAGKDRKRCIRAALKIQNFLACRVDNLAAIIANQGEYRTWQPNGSAYLPYKDLSWDLEHCIRWQLLSLRDAGAIRIE